MQVSLCQFLGGSTGSRLAQMLNQFHDTIRQITVQTKSCTRSCHTLLKDGGEATELIEPSSHVVSNLHDSREFLVSCTSLLNVFRFVQTFFFFCHAF